MQVLNIADKVYVGLPGVLSTFGPLLKPKAQNPYATLLVLHMSAVHEVVAVHKVWSSARDTEMH